MVESRDVLGLIVLGLRVVDFIDGTPIEKASITVGRHDIIANAIESDFIGYVCLACCKNELLGAVHHVRTPTKNKEWRRYLGGGGKEKRGESRESLSISLLSSPPLFFPYIEVIF